MKRRLDLLTNDNIIIKHHYTLPYRGVKFTGRDFYLLNWAKKQTKDRVSFIFNKQITRNSVSVMNKYVSRLSYEINSIYIAPRKREYTIIREGSLRVPNEYIFGHEFIEKIKEFRVKEGKIFEEIKFSIVRSKSIEERNELIEKRDSLLELIVLLCMRFCAYNYLGRNNSVLSRFDVLIFLSKMHVFEDWRPYVKFWEIMERIG